jgi:exosortase/archaeosortase family protein
LQFLARSPHRPTVYKGTSILVLPYHGIAFRALITPSCSAAASLLALAFLSSLSPRYGPGRRFVATAAALLMVAVGNIARISLSVLAGLFSGVSSLVLFHDWVGGIMTFVYTLGGYITMLMILLPGDDEDAAASSEADVGVGEGAVVGVT